MSGKIIWIILAAICILYGILILSLRSGTAFFAVWFGLGGICGLFAAASHVHLWERLPAGGKAACLIVLAAGLAVFVFTEARIIREFRNTGEQRLDCLIVLGAQVRDDGPSVVLRYRLDTACAYLQENPDTICIVSGGRGMNEPCPEAEIMKEYLTGKGIPEKRILAETESRNTLENIRNSMWMFDPETDRVGIVTNNFHLYRGCSIAEKAGIRHVSGIAAPSRLLYLPNNLLREFFGVIKDRISGNI